MAEDDREMEAATPRGTRDVSTTNTKLVVHIEARQKRESAVPAEDVREMVLDWFALHHGQVVRPGKHAVQSDAALAEHVAYIRVDAEQPFPGWQAELVVHVYKVNEEESYDETTEDDPTSTVFTHWELPSTQFEGLWESLLFDHGIKDHLLEFAATSLLFSARNVNPNVISWNHVVLLHGPPGTGKTSLCQALAHKLSIRLGSSFRETQLLEINSHSLFSKWFSESGKLVSKLFSYIHELAEEESTLLCILIDEVESLAAARSAAVAGSEPSDSIRVVNALLTQIDRLKSRKNVIILTTSNITDAIDVAFVDRADIRQYIGLPEAPVRAMIIRDCVDELVRAGIVDQGPPEESLWSREAEDLLKECAAAAKGLSGRALRKLPFQAYARFVREPRVPVRRFLNLLAEAAELEGASLASGSNAAGAAGAAATS